MGCVNKHSLAHHFISEFLLITQDIALSEAKMGNYPSKSNYLVNRVRLETYWQTSNSSLRGSILGP